MRHPSASTGCGRTPRPCASGCPTRCEGSLLPGARSVLVFPRHRIEIDVLEAEPDTRFKFRWTHPPRGRPHHRGHRRHPAHGLRLHRVSLSDGPYDTDDEAVLDEYARAIEIWAGALDAAASLGRLLRRPAQGALGEPAQAAAASSRMLEQLLGAVEAELLGRRPHRRRRARSAASTAPTGSAAPKRSLSARENSIG